MSRSTLYDKLWDSHVVEAREDGAALLYIDRHLVHEVTSPQAFEGLQLAGRPVRRPERTLAVADHNVPTTGRHLGIQDPTSRLQVETLERNVQDPAFRVPYIPLLDPRQGIVHIVGPEQGFTLPGTTIVCGDSHTSTHGAFGALAFGIGTSEVEHVLATQTLVQKRARTFRIICGGNLPRGVGAKDLVLHLIGRIGSAGGTGSALEFAGPAVRALSMEGRMTLCRAGRRPSWPWPHWWRGGTTASSSTSRQTTSTPRPRSDGPRPVRMAGCNGCRQPRFRVRRRAGAGSGAHDARRHGGRLGRGLPGTRQPGVRAAANRPKPPSCSRSRQPRTAPATGIASKPTRR